MGEGSAQADAEVIALAVEALRAAGIRDFLIELGQVKFVSGFLEEAGLTAQQCAAVRDMMAHKTRWTCSSTSTACPLKRTCRAA